MVKVCCFLLFTICFHVYMIRMKLVWIKRIRTSKKISHKTKQKRKINECRPLGSQLRTLLVTLEPHNEKKQHKPLQLPPWDIFTPWFTHTPWETKKNKHLRASFSYPHETYSHLDSHTHREKQIRKEEEEKQTSQGKFQLPPWDIFTPTPHDHTHVKKYYHTTLTLSG